MACVPRIPPYIQVVVRVNSPPSRGNVTVSPMKGTALSTLFSLGAWGWSDAEGNLPFLYGFGALNGKDTVTLSLEGTSANHTMQVRVGTDLVMEERASLR